jgi:carbon-monoxide dehydrogenase small subunit
MRIRVGPLAADFHGTAEFERDDATYSGVIHGIGRDTRSTSATRGSIRYRLRAIDERATRVELTIGYALTGPLAQFNRTDLVQDIAGRLIQKFVTQLEARLSGHATSAPDALHAGGLVFSVVMLRLRAWVRRILGRENSPP